MKLKIYACLIACLAITILYFYHAVICTDGTSSFINLLVLALMIILILFGSIGLKRLITFNIALENYKTTNQSNISCKYLSDAIELYKNDRKKIKDKNIAVSLSNYINEELYRRIANADYNEFVPNALTGIGILGTFLGLTLGLNQFDAQTADSMYGSITPLIDGIKVAFYTSILGVSLSVIYNLILKILFQQADKLVNDTQNTDKSDFQTDIQSVNLILDTLKNDLPMILVHDLPISIANEINPNKMVQTLNKSIEESVSALGNELTQKITKFQTDGIKILNVKIKESVSDLGNELTQKITNVQTDGIKILIADFSQKMNDLLSADFQNLKTGIEGIASWEQNLSADLQKWVPAMNTSIFQLAENHKDWNDIATRIEKITDECREQQDSLSKQSELISEQAVAYFVSFKEMNQLMLETVRNFISLENDMNEACHILKQNNENILNQIQSAIQNIESSSNKISDSCESINQLSGSLTNNISGQLQLISKQHIDSCKQFETVFAQAANETQNTSNQLSGAFTNFDSMLTSTTKQLEHISEQLSQSLSSLSKTANQAQNNAENFKDEYKSLIDSSKTINQKLTDTLGNIPEQFKELFDSANEKSHADALNIKDSLAALTHISTQFTSMNESIKRIPDMNQISSINQLSVNKLTEIQETLLEITKMNN